MLGGEVIVSPRQRSGFFAILKLASGIFSSRMNDPVLGKLAIAPQEIHVWQADLDVQETELTQLRATLSEDERARADRFHFEKDRRHFTAGRGFLRSLLAHYLRQKPSQLQFVYSDRGKPSLAPSLNPEQLAFNISHSNGIALYAFTRDRTIGIDLEQIRPLEDAAQLARRFFCPGEYEAMRSLPKAQQQHAFFNGWTRKEAYLKATGEGIAQLQAVEVSLLPGQPAALLRVPANTSLERWSLYELTVRSGYAAALAVEAQGLHLRYFDEIGELF